MLLGSANPYSLLSEAATADLLAPDVSEEAKDVIDDLETALTNNIEEVKPEDKSTNGGIPITTESVPVYKMQRPGRFKYLVEMTDIMRLCEDAATDDGSGDPVPADAGEVAEDIADKNDIDGSDVAIVINVEETALMLENVLLEAKAKSKSKKNLKKANKLSNAVKQLKAKGFKIVKGKK